MHDKSGLNRKGKGNKAQGNRQRSKKPGKNQNDGYRPGANEGEGTAALQEVQLMLKKLVFPVGQGGSFKRGTRSCFKKKIEGKKDQGGLIKNSNARGKT